MSGRIDEPEVRDLTNEDFGRGENFAIVRIGVRGIVVGVGMLMVVYREKGELSGDVFCLFMTPGCAVER